MRPMTYFLVKLKETKLKPGKKNGRTRMSKRKINKLMEENDYICIDGLIYDKDDNIIGSLVTKTVNQDYITKEEFKALSVIELMKRLGSLDGAKYNEVRSIGIKRKDNYLLE